MGRHRAIYPTEPTYTTDGNPRELEVLCALRDVDALLSYWLHKDTYSLKVITNLMRGHYIGIIQGDDHGLSREARLYAKQRNVFYPLTLWDAGEKLLKKRGMWRERRRQSDPFDHKIDRCAVERSLQVGAAEAVATYGFFEDIIAHPSCPWKATKDDKHPHHILFPKDEYIVPDFSFKVEKDNNFFAHCEVDTGTETLEGKGTTIEAKVRYYARYIHLRMFAKRYGLPKITILFYFTKASRKDAFLRIVKRVCAEFEPGLDQRFAAMVIENFRDLKIVNVNGENKPVYDYPPATGFAFTDDYERVGGTLNIATIIGASNGRTETLSDTRTHRDEAQH